jgi:hypothetical protein
LTILPRLQLRITERPHGTATALNALARRHDNAQAEKQDCPGYCRRTHSFRVGSPVHESFSERAPSGARLPAKPIPELLQPF